MSGSTNSKISQQNKQVEKQYEYDRKMYDYQNVQNQNRYENAKQLKDNEANAQQAVDYQNQIAMQNGSTAWILRTSSTKLIRKPKQSLKDYDDQVELNSVARAISEESEARKFEEVRLMLTSNATMQCLRKISSLLLLIMRLLNPRELQPTLESHIKLVSLSLVPNNCKLREAVT